MIALAVISAISCAATGFLYLATGHGMTATAMFVAATWSVLCAVANTRVKELEKTLDKRFSRGAILPKARED